ncbi:MAG: metallophosphoesterase family protein [Candidatus Komeilibacteria bacterium]
MNILLISDIHDNLPNLQVVLDFARQEKIGKLICCGDIGSTETLQYIIDNFVGEMWVVLGNADRDKGDYQVIAKQRNNIHLFIWEGKFSVAGQQVLLVHEPEKYEKFLNDPSIDYIFYGHTHKPWQAFKQGKTILNPGNISNYIYAPTCAVWQVENGKFSLIPLQLLYNSK